MIGKIRGAAHCALCDVTHGTLRKKPEWKSLVDSLDVPMEVVHLNERPPELKEATEGKTPCVVAEHGDGFEIILDAGALEEMDGSVGAFEDALRGALEGRMSLSLRRTDPGAPRS